MNDYVWSSIYYKVLYLGISLATSDFECNFTTSKSV